MESLEQKIKEYLSSVQLPDGISPGEIRTLLEDNGEMTAGVFLRKLKELKISGSDFLELLGNSKIGNMEFRRIEENPHLKFDELLQILDNSVLSSEDYRMIIAVATQRKELSEQRKRREEETLRRMTEELTGKKSVHTDEESGTDNKESNAAIPVEKTEEKPMTAESDEKLPEEKPAAEESGGKQADFEANEAAQAIIERMQSSIDKELNVETVENSSDYTESNDNLSDEENANNSEDEKEITQEFEISKPSADEDTEQEDEDDDYVSPIPEEERIGSSAEDIGSAIGELMDDEDEEAPCKRSKACLVTMFVMAAVLICGGFALNLLREYGIIPQLIYELPETLEQDITDYATLLSEAKAADGKLSYTLPDSLIIGENLRFGTKKTICTDTLTAVIDEDIICGAKISEGKLSDNFSFETGLTDVGIIYFGGYFAIIGKDEQSTVLRIYDEEGFIGGKPVEEYILSGEFVDCYTKGNIIYLLTSDSFDTAKANESEPFTFVPSYTVGETKTSVPFDRIFIMDKANKLEYFTVTAVNADEKGSITVRSMLAGENADAALTENGAYAAVTAKLGDDYISAVAYTAFNDGLTAYGNTFDGAINPTLIRAANGKTIIVGTEYSEKTEKNVVLAYNTDLSEPSILTGFAQGEKIASATVNDKILSFVTADDKPLQYNIDMNSMSQAEAPETTNSVKINDNCTAQVTMTADKDGNRTGIRLEVGGDEKAEKLITAESNTPGDWNSYLSSPACDDISKLAYAEIGTKIIFGVPLSYFDGVSQVSMFRFFGYENGKLTELGKLSLYDEKIDSLECKIVGGEKPYIITMWDKRIITASADKIKVISDTRLKPAEKKETADESTSSDKTSSTESKGESDA
ncbi:MAG: beta-propeller domain-containing protein [Ruminiclostridium sp.]